MEEKEICNEIIQSNSKIREEILNKIEKDIKNDGDRLLLEVLGIVDFLEIKNISLRKIFNNFSINRRLAIVSWLIINTNPAVFSKTDKILNHEHCAEHQAKIIEYLKNVDLLEKHFLEVKDFMDEHEYFNINWFDWKRKQPVVWKATGEKCERNFNLIQEKYGIFL